MPSFSIPTEISELILPFKRLGSEHLDCDLAEHLTPCLSLSTSNQVTLLNGPGPAMGVHHHPAFSANAPNFFVEPLMTFCRTPGFHGSQCENCCCTVCLRTLAALYLTGGCGAIYISLLGEIICKYASPTSQGHYKVSIIHRILFQLFGWTVLSESKYLYISQYQTRDKKKFSKER